MTELVCQRCGKRYGEDEPVWHCACNGLVDIVIKKHFSIKKLKKRQTTIWRYREMIPLKEDKNIVSFNEGFTPFLELKLDGKSVLFKQDYLFPTGSFKDRGASVLVSKIKEFGIKRVLIDSSGNAGCAVAAYCARANIDCIVLVPENTSSEKLTQIKSYGAKLYVVQGTRDETARVALNMAKKIYYASHYYNPYFFHGTKTFAYEIAEQLNWHAPDTLVLPVGNGTLLLGAYIGFNELYLNKIIKKMPKLIGVQSIGCAPLFRMLNQNINILPKLTVKSTIAEGIAIARPPRAAQLIRAIKNTQGTIITVTDIEIKRALKEMYRGGIYMEPTAGACVAGVKKYLKSLQKNEIIVSTFTGHGLKSNKGIC